jgi:hypothetical protein
VLRLTPLTGGRSAWGGQLVAAEVSAERPVPDGAVAARDGAATGGGTLALSPHNAAAVDRALGREHDWQPIAATLRDGLLEAVTR